MGFWEFLWFTIVVFAFVAYLIVLLNIVTDLFRDKGLSGGWKALWMACLVFLPFLTAVVYLIARGEGMAERQAAVVGRAVAAQEDYIKSVVGTGTPAEEIARAKELLDAGTITQAEFDAIKARALA